LSIFIYQSYAHLQPLHSFPTRRSSDLTYAVNANVGFYESVAGLGLNPGDVTINGHVTVDAFNASDAGNATQNFWRSAENLTINPDRKSTRLNSSHVSISYAVFCLKKKK